MSFVFLCFHLKGMYICKFGGVCLSRRILALVITYKGFCGVCFDILAVVWRSCCGFYDVLLVLGV